MPPLTFTASHSSRITKPSTRNPLIRKTSSPLKSSNAHRKSSSPAITTTTTTTITKPTSSTPRLPDQTPIPSFPSPLSIPHRLNHILTSTFDPLPPHSTGLNSTATAKLLTFRRDLPPLVTSAHVHALSAAHTAADREIASLAARGLLRKVRVPGRGAGRGAVGECLVATDTWVDCVSRSGAVSGPVKERYIRALRECAGVTAPASLFSVQETEELLSAGFLVSSSQYDAAMGSAPELKPDKGTTGSLASLATVGSRAPAGTVAAVGGDSAFHRAGGGGGGVGGAGARGSATSEDEGGGGGGSHAFSLPSTGLYLRLLTSAVSHLLSLLSKFPHKETTADILRERWDGGVALPPNPHLDPARPTSDGANNIAPTGGGFLASGPPSETGERIGPGKRVLPGHTRKWKQFSGLRFQWVLEECLGAGLVECFDTGAVGLGVRVVT